MPKSLNSFLLVARWVCIAIAGSACDKPLRDDLPRVGDVLWRLPVVYDFHLWHGMPAALDDRVYLDVENSIRAYDARSGRELWSTAIRSGMSPDSKNLVVSAGLVLVSQPTGIIALDAVTGAFRWNVSPDDSIIQSFGAADGKAYYTGTRGQKVHALSLPGGAVLWSNDLTHPDWVKANVVGLAVSGDTVFATGIIRRTSAILPRDIFIVALDRNDGRELWRYETGNGGDHVVYSAPLVTRQFVIMPDERERVVVAFDRQTGARRWSVYTDSSWGGPGPIPSESGGVVYFGSSDQYIYAVNLATGGLIWKTKTDASVTHVVVCGDYLYANNQAALILNRHTGQFVREVANDPDDFPTSHFLVLKDRVIASGTEAIYAFAC